MRAVKLVLVYAVLVYGVLTIIGWVHRVDPASAWPGDRPAPGAGDLGVFEAPTEGVWVFGWWAVDDSKVAAVIVVLAFVPALVVAVSSVLPRSVQKDPVRMFTATQRGKGFARAGNRCELESWWWRRCRRPAEHADHFVPWSRGGSSDLGNLVAACTRCNTSKGAKVPTPFQRLRLERRRRRYFPEHIGVEAGGKVPMPPSAYR